jgi:hypothetical protein
MNFKSQEEKDIKENKKITELDLEKKIHKLTLIIGDYYGKTSYTSN